MVYHGYCKKHQRRMTMGHHGEGRCSLCDKEERQKTRMTQRDYLENFLPFFNKMAQLMADNFKAKGHTWKEECSWAYLMDKMFAQIEDLQNDPEREDYYANIANYCAMLWLRELQDSEQKTADSIEGRTG